MKYLPGIGVSKLSGTMGGVTAQNWRGLGIFRRKPIPTKTLTARQMFINSLMSLLSKAWRDELNRGLRTAWNQRAKNYPWTDVFGNERKMTGENLYIKQNMVLLDHGLTRQDTPVPDVVPAELLDVVFTGEPENMFLHVPQISAGDLADTPFIDVYVAGGYTSTTKADNGIYELNIKSLCLPQGRTHQKSDFRHVAYVDDKLVTEPIESSAISIDPPAGWTRNIVVILRRYNKYGNFSAPRTFTHIAHGE